MGNFGRVRIPAGPRPTPRPMPLGPTRPAPARRRPDCALGNLRGGGRVCYGDRVGVIHNEHCPQARRAARERAVWAWVQTVLLILLFGLMAAAACLNVWAQTCGMGAVC